MVLRRAIWRPSQTSREWHYGTSCVYGRRKVGLVLMARKTGNNDRPFTRALKVEHCGWERIKSRRTALCDSSSRWVLIG